MTVGYVDNPISKKRLKEAEEETRNEILKLIEGASDIKDVLHHAKWELSYIEDELGKRSIPYGGGFVVGHGRRKRLLAQYFPGVPGEVLDIKWRIYKNFIAELEPIIDEINHCLWTFSYAEVKQMAVAEKISVAGGKIWMCKELIRKGWRVADKRLVQAEAK